MLEEENCPGFGVLLWWDTIRKVGFWKRRGGEGSMLLGKVLVGFQGVRCGNGVFGAGVMKLPSQFPFGRRLCIV